MTNVHPFAIEATKHDVELERVRLMQRLKALKLECQVNPCPELYEEAGHVMEQLQRLNLQERSR
jgi:hypothetical protein